MSDLLTVSEVARILRVEQLSLFEEEPIPPGYERVPDVGETYVWTTRFADGDTSHEALQKLADAHVCPGHWLTTMTKKTTTGDLIFFRNEEAHVEGDHVVVTSRRFETPKMFRKRHDYKDEDGDEEL